MSIQRDITVIVDRAKFFEICRVLQRNWSGSYLGPVIFSVAEGKLTIMSKRGGGEIPCGDGQAVSAEVSPGQFRKLVTAGRGEKSASGEMTFTFRPALGEVAIDIAGAKARFL